jgi:hypothetical protein
MQGFRNQPQSMLRQIQPAFPTHGMSHRPKRLYRKLVEGKYLSSRWLVQQSQHFRHRLRIGQRQGQAHCASALNWHDQAQL